MCFTRRTVKPRETNINSASDKEVKTEGTKPRHCQFAKAKGGREGFETSKQRAQEPQQLKVRAMNPEGESRTATTESEVCKTQASSAAGQSKISKQDVGTAQQVGRSSSHVSPTKEGGTLM